MVSTQDRPTPAPRTSLNDRKPPVPNRTLKPAIIPNPLITLTDSAKRIPNSWLNQIDLPTQNLSSRRNLRRVKSLSDIQKIVTTNINRSASSSIQSTDDCRNTRDEILNSGSLERGHVARIAKMLDAAISGSATSTVRSIDKQKGSSISINLVAGHNFSSITETSKYLPEGDTISDDVNKNHSNISVVSDPEIVPRNGLWNSGYIGLEAYSRMVEFLPDDVWANNR